MCLRSVEAGKLASSASTCAEQYTIRVVTPERFLDLWKQPAWFQLKCIFSSSETDGKMQPSSWNIVQITYNKRYSQNNNHRNRVRYIRKKVFTSRVLVFMRFQLKRTLAKVSERSRFWLHLKKGQRFLCHALIPSWLFPVLKISLSLTLTKHSDPCNSSHENMNRALVGRSWHSRKADMQIWFTMDMRWQWNLSKYAE